ncbi:unannotated protein [freshwater metagenome]|uniref:Unannotated protein n=1 Tax=freshwater metagenome TaxID=449393 RepID=A0A6J6X1W1_9ZZZZ
MELLRSEFGNSPLTDMMFTVADGNVFVSVALT